MSRQEALWDDGARKSYKHKEKAAGLGDSPCTTAVYLPEAVELPPPGA
jgi:hypothetical protein